MSVEGWLLVLVMFCLVLLTRVIAALGTVGLPWYRDATFLVGVPWLASSLVYALPLFVYREALEMRHVAYISVCLGGFFCGALVARFSEKRASPTVLADTTPARPESAKLLWAVALAGLAGQAAVLAGGLLNSPVSLADRVLGDGLAQVRLGSLGLADAAGPYTRFTVLAAASFVFLFMLAGGEAWRAQLSKPSERVMWLVALLTVLMVGFNALFIRGGRMEVVLMVLGLGLAALLDERRTVLGRVRLIFKRGGWLWATLFVVVVLVLSGFLATKFTKNRIGTASAYEAMAAYHRAKPSTELELATQRQPMLEFAVLNLSYFSVPLTTLGYYYDLPGSLFPGPFWGQYNLTYPVTFFMRRIGLRDEQHTTYDIRRQATIDLSLRGYGENVWSTALRDIAFDLGWSGAAASMLLVGGVSQRILSGAGRRRRGVMLALAPLTGLMLVMSAAHSLLVLESYAAALYFCLITMVVNAVLGAFRARSPLAAARLAQGAVVRPALRTGASSR